MLDKTNMTEVNNSKGNNSNNNQQDFNEDDNATFETEDHFKVNDGRLIYEQNKHGKTPVIPERGSTAWKPRHNHQLID